MVEIILMRVQNYNIVVGFVDILAVAQIVGFVVGHLNTEVGMSSPQF
jgi:hypothetical protein